MSLAELGDHVGITYQQIQKYETGQTRIGASRLFELAQTLDMPVEYFFEDISSLDTPPHFELAELESSGFLHEVLSNQDAIDLNRTFIEIEDKDVRRSVIDLINALAD